MSLEKRFFPREQSEHMLGFSRRLWGFEALVGERGIRGARYRFGPLVLETYFCDQEPVLEPVRGLRFVLWHTFLEEKQGHGWRRMHLPSIGETSAFVFVDEQYLTRFSSSARRWVRFHGKHHTLLQQVSFEEFARAYHEYSHLDALLRSGFLRVIKNHQLTHGEDVSLILARHPDTGALYGGAAFVDLPDISQSLYVVSFLTPEGRKPGAAYAYIDWWLKDLSQKGIAYADLGIVWSPGDPRSWKGYSEFKHRFYPEYKTRRSFFRITVHI